MSKSILILGESGHGKTTSLEKITTVANLLYRL